MPKIKKIKPYTARWEREANKVARTYAPEIYPCETCGYPVATGYCCGYCGSCDPSCPNEQKDKKCHTKTKSIKIQNQKSATI